MPRPHEGQQHIINTAKRFNVLCCGVRFGKTTLGIDRVANAAVNGFPTAWFAPTYKLLADAWREMISDNWLGPVIAHKNTEERRLELIGGGSVDFWSLEDASENTARGRKYKVVVIDEASGVKNIITIWQSLIRTRLTDYQGDAWFLSTPRGMGGFKTLFDYGQDPLRPEWMSWNMPTTRNPHMTVAEVEEARKDLSENRFKQEYEGDFINWDGAVFRNIRECIADCLQPGPEPGHKYAIGGDWGKQDFTVFSVLDITDRKIVQIDRSNQINYSLQRGRLQVLRDKWKPVSIVVEHNSIGDPIVEQLLKDNIRVTPFDTSNASKSALVEAFSLALERSSIKIPNDATLISELEAYTGSTLPSGLIRYSAPEGQNDDIVIATMLSWYAAFAGLKVFGVVEAAAAAEAAGSSLNAMVNDYAKATANVNKIQTSALVKPVVPDNIKACPSCSSPAIVFFNRKLHCNQCGFDDKNDASSKIGGERGDYLLLKAS